MSDVVFNMTHPSNFVLSVVTGTIGSVGLPGNFFLMLLILSEYKKRKPHEWLVFTLALGDFLLCLNSATLEAPFILNFATIECKVAGGIDYALGIVSFFTPPLVAYNRYLSLYDNQRYLKVFTTKSVFAAWGLILGFGLCWIIPYAATDSLGQDDLGVCGTQLKNRLLAGNFILIVMAIGLSYALLLYFSYKVIALIRNHRKQAQKQSRLRSRLMNESQEIITCMLIISSVPLFAQLPSVVVKGLQIFLPPFSPWVGRLTIATFPLTSAVNAYVTVYVVKDYRKKLIRFFNRKTAPVTISQIPTGDLQRETRTEKRTEPGVPQAQA